MHQHVPPGAPAPAAAARLAGPRCIAAIASGLRLSGCGVGSAGGPAGAAAAAAGLQELLLEEVDDLGEQVRLGCVLVVPGSAPYIMAEAWWYRALQAVVFHAVPRVADAARVALLLRALAG
jgi:hypothetical protein